MMIGIRHCFGLAGLAIAAAGALAIGASSASAQQSFTAPAPSEYPPNWDRPAQSVPTPATFVPGSDAYHWTEGSSPQPATSAYSATTFVPGSDAYHWANGPAPSSTASASSVVYQMQPGSNHYHRVQ
jgi:hypothetical protein